MILEGNVYTGPYDATTPLGPDGKPLWKIQRKPDYVQNALWRTIYDNDFTPHLGPATHAWTQPWQQETPSAGWKLSEPASSLWPDGSPSRVFDFANAQDGGSIAFNPEANAETHALTDYLAYDEAEHRDLRHQGWQPLFVNDLKLGCTYTRRSGDGPLRLSCPGTRTFSPPK